MAEGWIAPCSKTAGSLVGFHFNCHQRTARRENLEAAVHGGLRFVQGHSASMLVEESWIFQVTTFGTLHLHQSELDHDQGLL